MIEVTKRTLTERFAQRFGGVPADWYAAVSGIVDVAVASGQGKEIGNEPRPAGTKGKPSKVYQLNNVFNLNLEIATPVVTVTAPETPAVTESVAESALDAALAEVPADTQPTLAAA